MGQTLLDSWENFVPEGWIRTPREHPFGRRAQSNYEQFFQICAFFKTDFRVYLESYWRQIFFNE